MSLLAALALVSVSRANPSLSRLAWLASSGASDSHTLSFSAFPLKQARGLARAQPESDGSAARQHQARQVPDQPAGKLGTGESGDPGCAATKVEQFCSTQRDLLSTAIQDEIEHLTTNAELVPESSVRMPFLPLARRRRPLVPCPRVTR